MLPRKQKSGQVKREKGMGERTLYLPRKDNLTHLPFSFLFFFESPIFIF